MGHKKEKHEVKNLSLAFKVNVSDQKLSVLLLQIDDTQVGVLSSTTLYSSSTQQMFHSLYRYPLMLKKYVGVGWVNLGTQDFFLLDFVS